MLLFFRNHSKCFLKYWYYCYWLYLFTTGGPKDIGLGGVFLLLAESSFLDIQENSLCYNLTLQSTWIIYTSESNYDHCMISNRME